MLLSISFDIKSVFGDIISKICEGEKLDTKKGRTKYIVFINQLQRKILRKLCGENITIDSQKNIIILQLKIHNIIYYIPH